MGFKLTTKPLQVRRANQYQYHILLHCLLCQPISISYSLALFITSTNINIIFSYIVYYINQCQYHILLHCLLLHESLKKLNIKHILNFH